jgi:hypothetical protein
MLSYFSQYSPQGLMPQSLPGLQGPGWPQMNSGLFGQPGTHSGYGPHAPSGGPQVITLLGHLAQQIAVQGSIAQQQGAIAQQIGVALYQLSQHLAQSSLAPSLGALEAGYGQSIHAFGGAGAQPYGAQSYGQQPFGQAFGQQPFTQQSFPQQPFGQPFGQQPFVQGPFGASQTGAWAANRPPTIN